MLRIITYRFSCAKQCRGISALMNLSENVQSALKSHLPIVALETALVTHGMPFPENIKTCIAAENAIASKGAVPATIAILKGKVKVGLSRKELEELAEGTFPVIKTSRRDFSYAITKKINGGTTVSGTMVIAKLAGIRVFATGGIGGVHRGGESTLDISADLTELGRTPIVVVSSGVKAILDIPRTLEFLETQGVCVAALGPQGSMFPAFYSQGSGVKAPLCVENPQEAARMLHSLVQLGIQSGMLLAVPIPSQHALPGITLQVFILWMDKKSFSPADMPTNHNFLFNLLCSTMDNNLCMLSKFAMPFIFNIRQFMEIKHTTLSTPVWGCWSPIGRLSRWQFGGCLAWLARWVSGKLTSRGGPKPAIGAPGLLEVGGGLTTQSGKKYCYKI